MITRSLRYPTPRPCSSASNTGFTLIELLITITIVGILAAIAYPTYNDSVRKSRRGQAKADLVELAQRAERYRTLNNSYAGFWASVSDGDKRSPRTGVAQYAMERENDDSEGEAFVLRAVPKNSQTADTACGTLTINQAGVRTKTGDAEDVSRCW